MTMTEEQAHEAAGQLTPEEAQKRIGRRGIGGADMAALVGLSRWKSPLDVWAQKLGLVEKVVQNEPMKWGQLLEPLIAREYAERTGRRLRKIDNPRHPKHNWMTGQIDRLVVGEPGMVECKASAWKGDEWGEEGTAEIDEGYYIQVQHCLGLVEALEWADCAVLFRGNHFEMFHVEPDRELIKDLIEIGADFWNRYVLTGTPPPVEGTKLCADYLSKRFALGDGEELVADSKLSTLAEELKDARTNVDATVESKLLIENEIKAIMGDAARIVGDGFRISWKKSKDSEATDWKAVAENGIDDEKMLGRLVTGYTKVRPGSRRFLVKFDKDKD